ncbi:hypothetical protein C8R48DRAFT_781381 [Suillus tomentosus]|nr:hypothetical protein C8R48DRAFT_781381 [Suillus tomentosus]
MRQELARLRDNAPSQDSSMTPSTGIRCQCYELFKKTYPDTYQDIPNTYEELNILTDTQTIAQYMQSFQKLYKRVGSILDGATARQGFKAALVMCGNIVNEDVLLGHVQTLSIVWIQPTSNFHALSLSAVIASKEPVIIGEAPPVDSSFPNARCMFVNGTFDYNGPTHLQPSSTITRKKKPKVPSSSHTQDDGSDTAVKDTTTTIHKTNLRPEVLIPSPPPPSCPFKLAKRLPTKLVQAPIEILSSPDDIDKPDEEEPPDLSNGELHSEDDANYDDFSHSWKRKLNTGGKNKPSAKAAGKAHAKGGHSSPLTMGFLGDEKQQPPPTIDNAAACIHNGPPDVAKVRCTCPVAKRSQPPLTKAMCLLQEDEHLQNNGGVMYPETSVDRPTSAQVTETPILLVVLSSTHNLEHPAKHTEGNGQSACVQDVPPPLPQNPPHALSEDTHPSPAISSHDALESHHAVPHRAHNNHSHEPPNN